MNLESLFIRAWYGNCPWTTVFRPILPLIKNTVLKKRSAFLANPGQSYTAPVPVIVVGNISVGGTGKSPMVVALCELLLSRGYHPGIISRGHGVKLAKPTFVDVNSLASQIGDEPAMLVRRTKCPMVVYPKRAEAIKHLLTVAHVDVIICDDGMQHYALNRDVEIAMIDAQRGVGNGQLLPVGPLREPVGRLESVDYVVSITAHMTPALSEIKGNVLMAELSSPSLVSLDGKRTLAFDEAFTSDRSWHVMAGIGNPDRFLTTLRTLGLKKIESIRWYGDHYHYNEENIPKHGSVVMTEKDAVKCQILGVKSSDIWYLPVSLVLPDIFTATLIEKLQHIKIEKHHE